MTTPVPFPPPLGLPASRLQDSGILKVEKPTSRHVLRSDFANTAPCRPHSPCPLASCPSSPCPCRPPMPLPASWALPVPCPTTADLMVFLLEIDLSLARGFGVPFGLSPTSAWNQQAPSCPLTPDSRDCYFRPLQSKVLWSVMGLVGPCTAPSAPATHTGHYSSATGGPWGAGRR